MKKIKQKISQEKIVAAVVEKATKKDFAKLSSFSVDHLCGCK